MLTIKDILNDVFFVFHITEQSDEISKAIVAFLCDRNFGEIFYYIKNRPSTLERKEIYAGDLEEMRAIFSLKSL